MIPTTTSVAIGIDIGGTKIAVGLVTGAGELVRPPERIPTPRGAAAILDAIDELTRRVAGSGSDHPIVVGIGSAGTFSAEGVVIAATDVIPGWAGTALAAHVTAFTSLPAFALNDVQAAAVGELRLGDLRDVPTGLLVAVGTGIGGAYVAQSGVVIGRSGIAGSIGHIQASRITGRRCTCGGVDHPEAYASGPAMERAYALETGVTADLVAIAAAAATGEPAAVRVLQDGADILGAALASMTQALDPHLIVLGGGVVDIGSRYVDAVRRAYAESSAPGTTVAPVVTAKLGPASVVIGAALHALDALGARS